jgi:hypothetical protein
MKPLPRFNGSTPGYDAIVLIARAGISYRREAFAKFRLLSLRFPLLVRLAGLLLRART